MLQQSIESQRRQPLPLQRLHQQLRPWQLRLPRHVFSDRCLLPGMPVEMVVLWPSYLLNWSPSEQVQWLMTFENSIFSFLSESSVGLLLGLSESVQWKLKAAEDCLYTSISPCLSLSLYPSFQLRSFLSTCQSSPSLSQSSKPLYN